MKRKVFVLCLLALLLALAGPALGGLKRDELNLTFAKTWDDGIAEAKARGVPIVFMWPDRG